MESTLRTVLIALASLLGQLNIAQTLVDIKLVPGQDNNVEVRIRPDATFDGYFAASVFAIRWSNASGANLGAIVQDPDVQLFHDVNKSGPEQVDGGYRYQIFAGFGGMVMSDIPDELLADEWIVLCTLPVLNATDAFFIVNDAWTAANNADFFISLNGVDSTGEIIDPNVAVAPVGSTDDILFVTPSPVVDDAMITFALDETADVSLMLMDATGQEVWSQQLNNTSRQTRQPLRMSAFSAGVYFLRMRTGELERTVQVVKR